MIHCCTFLVAHVLLIKVMYEVMPNNKINDDGLVIVMWHLVCSGH